jgi:hypothetical protein
MHMYVKIAGRTVSLLVDFFLLVFESSITLTERIILHISVFFFFYLLNALWVLYLLFLAV